MHVHERVHLNWNAGLFKFLICLQTHHPVSNDYYWPYQADFNEPIVQLITAIQQREFKVPISLTDEPDLQDISRFYQAKNGNFWQALTDDQAVIGTIGLLDMGQQIEHLQKMFVHPDFRGKNNGNVAARLLDVLEGWACGYSIKTIYLGTVNVLETAIHFYQKHQYKAIAARDLPAAFPCMAVDNVSFRKGCSSPQSRAVSVELPPIKFISITPLEPNV